MRVSWRQGGWVCGLTCLAAAACDPATTWPLAPARKTTPPPRTSTADSVGELSSGSAPIVQAVRMSFDLLRADFPRENTRHSLKVWNHVDRQCLDPRTMSRLARNGVRVGVANPEAWPAVKVILDAAKATLEPLTWEGQTGLPVVLPLGTVGEPQTIFSYGDSGRPSGKTFTTGQKIMQLDYAVHAHAGGSVELRLSFEVRHDRGEMTWESSGGVIRQVPAYDRHPFEELTAVLTVPPGAILVVGPDERADQEYLVGARFFDRAVDGSSVETLYFITPRPVRGPAARASAARSPPRNAEP